MDVRAGARRFGLALISVRSRWACKRRSRAGDCENDCEHGSEGAGARQAHGIHGSLLDDGALGVRVRCFRRVAWIFSSLYDLVLVLR